MSRIWLGREPHGSQRRRSGIGASPLQCLSAAAAIAAIAALFLAWPVDDAMAACTGSPTVTCSGTTTAVGTAFNGGNGLTINVQNGAIVSGTGSPGGIGFNIGSSDTVNNLGSVSGGDHGIVATTNLTVTNGSATNSTASITGTNLSAIQSSDANVTNFGTISGGVITNVGTVTIDNKAGATISATGTNAGVQGRTGATVANAGTLSSTSVTVQNTVSGDINIISNSGTITTSGATAGAAAIFQSGSGAITVSNSNTISNTGAGQGAIVSSGGGDVNITSNTGTISTANGIAISGGGTVTVNNNSGGTISGVGAIQGKTVNLTNVGMVTGGSNRAVGATGALTITNGTAGGPNAGVAISSSAITILSSSSANITNFATISGNSTNGTINTSGSATITNSGTVSGGGASNAVAVLTNNALSLTNNAGAMITGVLDGVNQQGTDAVTINNAGTISGAGRSGLRLDSNASVTNTGTMTGLTGIVFRDHTGTNTPVVNGSVFNSGTITGTGGTAINFAATPGSGPFTLTLGPGFVVNGNALGTGADVFQLGGKGTGAFDLSTIGPAAQYQGFNTFNVISGTWMVSGTFGQSQAWNVNGGTLTGTGTLHSLNVNGGAFAPGTAPGTSMTINGNLTFQSAALYMVQVNATSTTFANVAGTATLAGNVSAAITSSGTLKSQYTILQSAGRNGTFGSLTTTGVPAGFTATLSYNADDVFLNIGPAIAQQPGLNQNQQNVANAISNFFNSGGTLPPNFLAVLGLSGASLANALTQRSGEPATDAEKGAFQLMTQFLGVLLDPFVYDRSAFGGGSAPAFAPEQEASFPPDIALAYAGVLKKAPPKPILDQRWTVWGSAFGGYNKTDGNSVIGSNDVSARDYGFAGGMDYHYSPDTVFGFALAGGATNWDLAQGLGGGRSDAFMAGAYGKTHFGPAYVAAALAFADHWFTTNRNGGFGDQLTAKFNGQSYGGRLEAGYRYAAAPMFGVTPYAALQVQSFHTPAYSETDLTSGGFGLSFNAMDATDARSELGARFDDLTMLGSMPLVLRARAAWAHDWVSNPALGAAFQALPGASFTVNGAAPPKNSALTTAGGQLYFTPKLSFLAKFDGEFASGSQTYAGTGTLRYTW